MRRSAIQAYRCPYTGTALTEVVTKEAADEVVEGRLEAGARVYVVRNGIPDFLSAPDDSPSEEELRERSYYDSMAREYDAIIDWMFRSFREDEALVRSKMSDALETSAGASVLETGCGTCRDSVWIARKIGATGRLFLQDVSGPMLEIGRGRIDSIAVQNRPCVELSRGDATRLPFADRTFDAAFHFGGINFFSDRRAAIAEMARVVRIGGKVVFGDESLGPWLRETLYGKILQNSNALYKHHVPTDLLPECARDVRVQWIIGGAYYLIDFRVEQGPPVLELDLPILGRRGGTHRTRYYGRLEGVTPEAKEMAERSASQAGKSLHEWLDEAVRAHAQRR